MIITLPVQLNPISRRRDRSVKLSFETREMTAEEVISLMAIEGSEMWMFLSPNPDEVPDIPKEIAEVDEKTPSERLRAVLFIWYKQLTESGKYVGTFNPFKDEKMEKIIESIKSKLI